MSIERTWMSLAKWSARAEWLDTLTRLRPRCTSSRDKSWSLGTARSSHSASKSTRWWTKLPWPSQTGWPKPSKTKCRSRCIFFFYYQEKVSSISPVIETFSWKRKPLEIKTCKDTKNVIISLKYIYVFKLSFPYLIFSFRMPSVMSPLGPREHWKGIYRDLWTYLVNPRSIGHAQNLTGADVQLCCREGKQAFHQNLLRKFTNLLDFTR